MHGVFLTLVLLLSASWVGHEELYIRPQSTIEVRGCSNVTDFSCVIGGAYFADTIRISYDGGGPSIRFANFRFVLPVDKFACGNRFLTRDFLKTLCEEDHPEMIIQVQSYRRHRAHAQGLFDWGELEAQFTIAGVSKTYRSEVRRDLLNDGFRLHGTLRVNICEFGLEPKPSMPLVKVEDALEVDFNFLFDQL